MGFHFDPKNRDISTVLNFCCMQIEQVEFAGWPECIRLSNAEVDVVVATKIGLRILRFGFTGGPNAFYLDPAQCGSTGGKEWKIYGGHRLWQAPEGFPDSYSPDNDPVTCRVSGDTLVIVQAEDAVTGLVKEMEIRLHDQSNRVDVNHRLINKNAFAVHYAPWAISVMTPGGTAVVPQEPYGEGNDFLLPARTLALWSYTKMSDERWTWGDRYIRARQQGGVKGEQKIGLKNRQGWSGYFFEDFFFIKKFGFAENDVYADQGCNNEIYFNELFLEVESLGPLLTIAPGGSAEHRETWLLEKNVSRQEDAALEQTLKPILEKLNLR